MRCGLTLIELIVTVSIIGILASLLLSTLSRSKERAKRVVCLQNLHQLGIATLSYADDDSHGSLSAKTSAEDQDLNWLLPYAKNRHVFACPSTQNFIRTNGGINRFTKSQGLLDLIFLAPSSGRVPGASYQGFGFTGVGVDTFEEIPLNGTVKTINGMRKNLRNILTYRHYHEELGLKGILPGPSKFWLIGDQGLLGLLYYPDNLDNHGANGVNITFCDGHAEWIGTDNYIYSYELSQDEGRNGIGLPWN